MLTRFRPRLTYANILVTLLAFVVLAGGGAFAASRFVGSGGEIRACVDKKGGLRLLKRGKNCNKGTSEVAWNQVGPPGARGPQGSQGATGTVDTSGFYSKSESDSRFLHGAGSAAKIDYHCVTGQSNTCEYTSQTVLAIDDLTLKAGCNGSAGISLTASTSVDGARLGVNVNHSNPGPENNVTSPFDAAAPVSVLATYTDFGNGTVVYSRPGGPAVSITLEYGTSSASSGFVCDLHGTALAAG